MTSYFPSSSILKWMPHNWKAMTDGKVMMDGIALYITFELISIVVAVVLT